MGIGYCIIYLCAIMVFSSYKDKNMDNLETVDFKIPTYMFGSFESKLETLNKKINKIKGADNIKIIDKKEVEVCIGEDVYGDKNYQSFYEISVNSPTDTLKQKGFQFVGSVSNNKGNVSYNCANNINEDDRKVIMSKDIGKCDHCGKKHSLRKHIHFFKKV